MITATERFEIMTAKMRPQDPGMDGSGLTFKTLEHGGEYPDLMPQAIKLTDAEGRWCIYTPTAFRGEAVRHDEVKAIKACLPKTAMLEHCTEEAREALENLQAVLAETVENQLTPKTPVAEQPGSGVG